MSLPSPGESIAEQVAGFATALRSEAPPAPVAAIATRQLLDVAGLCVAARHEDYVKAVLAAGEGQGACTVIGHAVTRCAAEAALVNGTAAHGEDFDDTFEGTPVHAGAVVVPAVLAACEDEGLDGARALAGIAAGVELMCRMALVTPTAIHRAGFHPTAVIGALGAALGVGTAVGLNGQQLASALGIAGSMASGIIEYLAEGTWTKRLHAGWAAHCGVRAARLARAGFEGPRTVFEGRHGFFHAFTNVDMIPELSHLTRDLGSHWEMQGVAFKPYPCGTMAQPFIDCALALRASGASPESIESIRCDVGEGTVHRLWEPLAGKQRPASAYGAKFSVPFAIAVALVDGSAGLRQFTDDRARDPRVTALAGRIGYRINPDDEYPRNYTGHLQVTFSNGEIQDFRQPHLRGGRREPLADEELERKFEANVDFGGWSKALADDAKQHLDAILGGHEVVDLKPLRG